MLRNAGLGVCLAALCVNMGCSGGDPGVDGAGATGGTGGTGGANEDPGVLKVASSWSSASEQEALQVTLAAFQAQTGATVEVVALAQGQAARTAQFQDQDWDVGQENFYNLVNSFDDGNGGYTALNLSTAPELSEGLAAVFPQVVNNLTADGQVMGFPMNLHRENTLHYSKALMPNPPTTLTALTQVCDDYVAGGKTGPKPLALAPADWVYRILLQGLLPVSVLDGSDTDPTPHFLAALELIAHYQDNDCFWVAPSEHGWTEAAQALIDGEARMFIHGDWAKGYLVQLGWRPGIDFDVVPSPGSSGAFYYGVDVFALNKTSPQLDLAIEFARIALSSAVQAGFSTKKGSTPGMMFDDPSTAFADSSLRAAYGQLSSGMDTGSAVPVPPWIGNHGGALMVTLRDGTKTPTQVAADFTEIYLAR